MEEDEFDIKQYIQNNYVSYNTTYSIPSQYKYILYQNVYTDDKSPYFILTKDTENNVHMYSMITQKETPILYTSMYPSTANVLQQVIPLYVDDDTHNDNNFLFLFSKHNSRTENIIYIQHEKYKNIIVPTSWHIIQGFIVNHLLYIVVTHTLVGQRPEICTYYITDSDATTLSRYDHATNIITTDNRIISSTILNVNSSTFEWSCQNTIGIYDVSMYIACSHLFYTHNIQILQITAHDQTLCRVVFVDITHSLIELSYTNNECCTRVLTKNIQPYGQGAVLLSLSTIRSSITIQGLTVLIYGVGKCWKMLLSFNHGKTWGKPFTIPQDLYLQRNTSNSVYLTLQNQIIWCNTAQCTHILSLPIHHLETISQQYKIYNSGKVIWGGGILTKPNNIDLDHTTEDVYKEYTFPTSGISSNMKYMVFPEDITEDKNDQEVLSLSKLEHNHNMTGSWYKHSKISTKYNIVYIGESYNNVQCICRYLGFHNRTPTTSPPATLPTTSPPATTLPTTIQSQYIPFYNVQEPSTICDIVIKNKTSYVKIVLILLSGICIIMMLVSILLYHRKQQQFVSKRKRLINTVVTYSR